MKWNLDRYLEVVLIVPWIGDESSSSHYSTSALHTDELLTRYPLFHTYHRLIHPEYSPFLNWSSKDATTGDSLSPVFLSLVSMVRDGYKFDKKLVSKASQFLSSVYPTLDGAWKITAFLMAIGQGSPNPTAVFVDSMAVLLSSSHPPIFREALSFIRTSLRWTFPSNRRAIVSSELVPKVLSTPHLRDLSVIDVQDILNSIHTIFETVVWLSSPDFLQSFSTTSDPESIRDAVLHEALIPMEPSLVQISRNPRLLSWNEEYMNTLKVLTRIFEVSAFHQPTLDFICSSHLPMVFQTLLSKVEDEETHQYIIWFLTDNIRKWKRDGAETMHRGRILFQTLEQEGFRNHLEQTPLRNDLSRYGY
ncbi:hypothetical protein BLNAU_10163 [Blattamonas nauphoetae]|uniref:Uncharacterized protein n=1 Tax=Blattamonas nauphoetae TaxID=2049346 RepID=A0ABQ9XTM8_9EUKA|nr:hypothetical protein BLNAU_10163 [Blattamonas nauphoetae]